MKIVNTGSMYKIYGEDLKTFNELPVGTYRVCFNKMVGYFLESTSNIVIKEKIYGVHESKVTKIMNSFKKFERNLGVILSGDKGIGKSVCAKLISQRAIENGLPVIIVDEYTPGIASYLGDIEQEVVVLFDEFDKTFPINKGCDMDEDSRAPHPDCQSEMLSLFDGLNQGKKLFVVTCNKLSGINEFLVNRPGRFHYHLRFEYPTPDEIREYLTDKLDAQYHNQISDVISFSGKVDINYDCLRAIAFELQNGATFKEAISDLNIINYDISNEYVATLIFENGTRLTNKNCYIDFYGDDDGRRIRFYGEKIDILVEVDPSSSVYDSTRLINIIDGHNVNVLGCYDNDDKHIELPSNIACITFKRKQSNVMKFAV